MHLALRLPCPPHNLYTALHLQLCARKHGGGSALQRETILIPLASVNSSHRTQPDCTSHRTVFRATVPHPSSHCACSRCAWPDLIHCAACIQCPQPPVIFCQSYHCSPRRNERNYGTGFASFLDVSGSGVPEGWLVRVSFNGQSGMELLAADGGEMRSFEGVLPAAHYSLRTALYSLLATHYPLPTVCYSLLTAVLLITHYSPLTTCYSLLPTHYSLPTAYYRVVSSELWVVNCDS